MSIDPVEEKILRRIPLEILLAGVAVSIGVFPFFGLTSALLVLAGAVFSALGFIWLKASLTRFLGRERKTALRAGVLIYLARLVLILAIFLIIILLFPRKILAFGAGFSVLVPVFLIEGAVALARMKSWKS